MYRIIIVEDDSLIREGVQYALRQEGFLVYGAGTVKEAGKMMEERPDLILLDVNLPDGDGREFLKGLRKDSPIPVILLTARDREEDMLVAFDAGGDDYITKPFSMALLVKRIRAVLKRTGEQGRNYYYGRTITYDFENKTLRKDGEPVLLTPVEIQLLELFLNNKGRVLTREMLLDRIWGAKDVYVDDKTVNVAIRRLREKVEEDPGKPESIRTVFGIGYKWQEEEADGSGNGV